MEIRNKLEAVDGIGVGEGTGFYIEGRGIAVEALGDEIPKLPIHNQSNKIWDKCGLVLGQRMIKPEGLL